MRTKQEKMGHIFKEDALKVDDDLLGENNA
jgi:hypothetical protein